VISKKDEIGADFVVGLLYPTSGDAGCKTAIEALRQLAPNIRIHVEPYVEPPELRLARSASKPDVAALRAKSPSLTSTQAEVFSEVDAVLAMDLPIDVDSVAPKLKFVQCISTGTAHLQSCRFAAAGIRIANASGTSATSIAEFVIARILQEWKRLREIDANFKEQSWNPLYGEQLAGANDRLDWFGRH
jgi:phosphoglycerate dehydrogenase-like enzyme